MRRKSEFGVSFLFLSDVQRAASANREQVIFRALSDHIFKVEILETEKQLVGTSCVPPILRVNNFHTFGHTFEFIDLGMTTKADDRASWHRSYINQEKQFKCSTDIGITLKYCDFLESCNYSDNRIIRTH